MENNVFVRPYTAVENIEGINVEFIHAGEVCRFSPFLVVEDFITSFYSLKVKERLLQPFPLDVIPRFKHYFFTSNAKVQCIATFFQREIIYDSHMFTGQTEFTPFEQVNYLRDGNLLFEHFKFSSEALPYERCVQQLAYLSELRLPRSQERILVQNHMGETCLIENGDTIKIWLIKNWQAIMDIIY